MCVMNQVFPLIRRNMRPYRLYTGIVIFLTASLTPPLAAIDYADLSQVVVDTLGNAVAVWQGFNNDGDLYIKTASISAEGVWSNVDMISVAGQDAQNPIMDSDNCGNCVAVWTAKDFLTNNNVLYGSMRIALFGGSWSTPVQISDVNTNVNDDYKVKIAHGSLSDPVIVMWSAYDNAGLKLGVYAAITTFTQLGASWSPPQLIGGGT